MVADEKYSSIPRFDGTHYTKWKKLVDLWKKATKVDEDKQGPVLILNMSGKAQDIAMNLADTSIANVLIKMEEIYGDSMELVTKYEKFDSFTRSVEQSIKEYIHVFEQQVAELKVLKLEIPDLILGIKLLKGVSLSQNETAMARMKCKEITYAEVKSSLLAMTEDITKTVTKNNSVTVKSEPQDAEFTFYNHDCQCKCHCTHEEHDEIMYNSQHKPYTPRGYNGMNDKKRRCFGCGSLRHWVKNCPEKPQRIVRSKQDYENSNHPQNRKRKIYYEVAEASESENEEADASASKEKSIFFQTDVGNEVEDILLVGQTVNHAVLDCGASQTVCGKEWFQCYVDSLDENELNKISEKPSSMVFKFGVGSMKAWKQATIPVSICDRDILLSVQIVDTDIPLLLSLKSMKKLGMNLDLPNDNIIISDSSKEQKTYKLGLSSTGHYITPITKQSLILEENNKPASEDVKLPEVYFHNIMDNSNPKDIALKLHKRFAHASSNQIRTLLKNAKVDNKDIFNALSDIEKKCEFCMKHKRASPKPSVSIPLAYSFNEMVAMDLKQIQNEWILHCIDYITRFSAAHVVSNKSPEECIEKFFKIWISIFGPPRKIFSDNGGEFISDKTMAMCEAFNIEPKFTAAESPFSNGLCERHNALIGNMTEKVIEDTGCNLTVGLMWATHAKNSLINVYGFSPYQLVFGHNPNIPGNFNNKLPALSSASSCQVVADHLNSLHKAREAFLEAENSDRVRRALVGRVFSGTHQKFCIGDQVYYKKRDGKWHGPGHVIAQNGCQVLLKTGSRTLIKVHPCKIILKAEADSKLTDNVQTESHKDSPNVTSSQLAMGDESPYISENSDNQVVEITENTENIENEPEHQDYNVVSQSVSQPKKSSAQNPVKTGDIIIYSEPEEDNWQTATIQSRAGKSGGKYSSWYNVKLGDTTVRSIDLKNVDWILKEVHDEEANNFAGNHLAEAMVLTSVENNEEKFAVAKHTEIENWKKYGVFSKVQKNEYPNTDVLSCRWVNEIKEKEDGIQYRARLVVRGFEEIDAPQSDSPTANKSVIRIFLAFCNMFSFTLRSLDVKTAFLQSDSIQRIVLIKPPKEFREDKATVWKLNKFVYGLNDAARGWFLTVRKRLTNFGCKAVELDNSVFIMHQNGKLSGIAVIHVDDFLIGGDSYFEENVIKKLEETFTIGTQCVKEFKFAGWNMSQQNKGIYVDQIDYQQNILPIEIESARRTQLDHELNCTEKTAFQSGLGSLQWITSQSRPDLRFITLALSTRASNPKVEDLVKLNSAIKKLKKTTFKLCFPVIQNDHSTLEMYAFADAALSNLPDKVSSTRGSVIFLMNGNKATVLSWASKKIQRVVKGIINAECIALSMCIDEAMALRSTILQMLNLKDEAKNIPIYTFTDSNSLWSNIHSTNQATDLKLRREVQSIRQHIELGEVKDCYWVPSRMMLADCLTKTTASPDNLISVLTSGILDLDFK